LSADVAEKISELQKADKSLREQQNAQSALVSRLVAGGLTKQQFVDQESAVVKKRDEAKDKIAAVCAQLRAI